MYDIRFSDNAKKSFEKLEKTIQQRIVLALERARIRPEAYFIRLIDEPVYKLRVGDYRIIADIHRNELLILVIKIGHRNNVYK